MESIIQSPMIQYGSLGLAFVLAMAFIQAFFKLMSRCQQQEREQFQHHRERESAFTDQFLACIDRNSAALEKVEQSLQKIQLQLARSEVASVSFDEFR